MKQNNFFFTAKSKYDAMKLIANDFIFKQILPANFITFAWNVQQFNPRKKFIQHSTNGNLAANIYNTLSGIGKTVYSADPRHVNTKLLFTNNQFYNFRHTKTKKVIFFPMVPHQKYTNRILEQYVKVPDFKVSGGWVDRLYDEETIHNFQLAVDRADIVLLIGNNTVANSYLEQIGNPKKLRVIDSALDTFSYQPIERPYDDRVIFIYPAAYYTLRKGFPILLLAWQRFIEQYNPANAFLRIMGAPWADIDYLSFYNTPQTEFITTVYDSGSPTHLSFLNSGHYTVFPSLIEGQAGSLLEAMSCGNVPICTSESGIDASKYGGWIVDVGQVESLSNLLYTVYSQHNLTLWRRQSLAVRSKVEELHNFSVFNQKIAEVAREIL